MEYMLMPYRKLYRLIEGRSGRKEFWLFFLLNILILLALAGLAFLFAEGAASMNPSTALSGAFVGAGVGAAFLILIPIYIWYLLMAVAALAVTIRRFHDLGVTGWAYLGIMVVQFGAAFIHPYLPLLVFVLFLVVMALPGTKGANKWGEDPNDPVNVSTFE